MYFRNMFSHSNKVRKRNFFSVTNSNCIISIYLSNLYTIQTFDNLKLEIFKFRILEFNLKIQDFDYLRY